MILSSVSGESIVSFRTKDYEELYHFPFPVSKMYAPFYTPNDNTNARAIFKRWVKEPTKFWTTPN